MSAPEDTCRARNEGRPDDDRLPEDVFDSIYRRLDTRPGDDSPGIRWLDTTLPVETVAEQLATELIELAALRTV